VVEVPPSGAEAFAASVRSGLEGSMRLRFLALTPFFNLHSTFEQLPFLLFHHRED
jgi:hypothetical protein